MSLGVRGGAGHGSRRRRLYLARQVLLLLALAKAGLAVSAAAASPMVPRSDDVVLERLPDAGDAIARALRGKHRALAKDPANLTLALDVARGDLDRSRAMGDPRYLGRAEAALAPWPPSPQAPPATMLLRAVILQSNHDFGAALADLAQVLHQDSRNGQAWLTRASIRQAQADYAGALSDCGQLATMVLGLAPDICTASAMSLTGHAPLALKAVGVSLGVNAAEAARTPSVAVWALTLQAETAARLADPSAESWFARALAIDPRDPYLLAAWSDWLLDHDRAREVIGLLSDRTRIDPLLLRLALAEQRMGDPATDGHIADLATRFDASRLRNDTVHRREEARFALALLHQPGRAVTLARANWDVQREPADARILLESALASGQVSAAEPVLAWMRANSVQDVQLTALAARLHAGAIAKG